MQFGEIQVDDVRMYLFGDWDALKHGKKELRPEGELIQRWIKGEDIRTPEEWDVFQRYLRLEFEAERWYVSHLTKSLLALRDKLRHGAEEAQTAAHCPILPSEAYRFGTLQAHYQMRAMCSQYIQDILDQSAMIAEDVRIKTREVLDKDSLEVLENVTLEQKLNRLSAGLLQEIGKRMRVLDQQVQEGAEFVSKFAAAADEIEKGKDDGDSSNNTGS